MNVKKTYVKILKVEMNLLSTAFNRSTTKNKQSVKQSKLKLSWITTVFLM